MGAAETWRGQRRSVRRLATRAGAHRRDAAGLRRRMRARIGRIGEPRVVAWAFLAGLVWGSGYARARPTADSRRFLARLAGTLLWAWRFAHRIHATGAALGLDQDADMSRQGARAPGATGDGRD